MIRVLILFTALCLVSACESAENHAAGDVSAGDVSAGDVSAGERAYYLNCQSCHVVADDEGKVIAGRHTPIGPNLYSMIGRRAATVKGFRYSKSLIAAGEAGLVWDEESFVAYCMDPNGFVRKYLDDGSARSTMTFMLRDSEDALNLFAYLASVGAGAPNSSRGN